MKGVLLLIAFVVVACAQAQPPRPVSVTQSDDNHLTCKEIALEYEDNTIAAMGKIDRNRSNDIEEIFAAVFVWPGLVDLQNADGVEGNSLIERNLRLRALAEEKHCEGVNRWPQQPKKYS